MLNAMSQLIDAGERVVTIEDAAELQLQQPHVVRLETRPANLEGQGEITMRNLVKNALRMRPDRIICGEVRGEEAMDMLQAMNTGHDGSMCTLHANSPREAITRLENMIGMAAANLPTKAIRTQIVGAVNLIMQVSRMRDGMRRVTHVTEIVGMEGDVVTMQDLVRLRVSGREPRRHPAGRLQGCTRSAAFHQARRLFRAGPRPDGGHGRMTDVLTGSIDMLAATVFAAVLAVVLLLMAALAPSGDTSRRLRRRIEQTRRAGRADSGRARPDAPTSVRREQKRGILAPLSRHLQSLVPRVDTLGERLTRAGMTIGVADLFVYCALAGIGVTTAIQLTWHPPLALSGCAGIVAATGVPHLLLSSRIASRARRFVTMLPDAIDLIVRGIRSGLPVAEAINAIGQEIGRAGRCDVP